MVVLETSSNPTPILRNSLIESAFHLAEMIDEGGGQEGGGGGGRGIPLYANYCSDQTTRLQLERITGPIESIFNNLFYYYYYY